MTASERVVIYRSFLTIWSLNFGVGVFHELLLINFGEDELMQRRTTGRLAVREMQEDFDLSTGQLSQ